MTVVGIYTRISSDPEGRKLGVERQLEDCQALCERNGWTVHREYRDNDISASRYGKKKRPEYEALVADLKAGVIEGAVFYSQSRLSRRALEFHQFLEDFTAADGKVLAEVVGGEYDLSTPDGLFMAGLKAALAAKEADETSMRTKRAALAKAQKGEPQRNGTTPFGFEDDFVTHNPAQVAVIREVCERVLSGEGLRSVARDMERRGVVNARQRPISYQAWMVTLTSPRIAGFRHHAGELHKAQWEPIIDPTTWEALVAVLSSKKGTRPSNNVKHLLTGLLTCSTCNGKMVNNKQNSKKADGTRIIRDNYACRKSPGSTNCGKMSIKKDEVDERVKAFTFERILNTDFPARPKDHEGHSVAVDLLAARERLTKLEDDFYVRSIMAESAFYRLHRSISAQIEELESKLADQTADTTLRGIPRTFEALTEAWDTKGIEWQRAVVHSVCASITIHPAPNRGRYQNYSARVSIKPRELN